MSMTVAPLSELSTESMLDIAAAKIAAIISPSNSGGISARM